MRRAGTLVGAVGAAVLLWVGCGATFGLAARSVGEPTSAHKLPFPIPSPAVQPEPCPAPPVAPGPPGPPAPPPVVPDRAIPAVSSPPPRTVNLAPLTGKGLWLTLWPGQRLDVAAVVATARREHLHQLWLRTGSTQDGFYGGAVLRALVLSAHKAGIDVIAWDFPTLSDPAQDAARASEAFRDGADGFAPDSETQAEGTYLSAARVSYYLSLVRHDAGTRLVVAVVMRPVSYWLSHYPYQAEAPWVDAFAPMVYWSCTEPGSAVLEAIRNLDALRPVVPIGQDYDMASEGGRHGLPSPAEIWRFLDVAHRGGAFGASLYDMESGGPAQLSTLGEYPWRASTTPVWYRAAA